MSRIQLTDNIMSAMVKMSDGNPGALAAMADTLKIEKEVDPDAALTPMATILGLDTIGVYGSGIYVLWNDQCNRDAASLIALLRAHQLGFISSHEVKRAADDEARSVKLPIADLWKKVCETLPNFRKPVAA